MMSFIATLSLAKYFPVLCVPAFMPGFRHKPATGGGTTGQPMGLLLTLTYAS